MKVTDLKTTEYASHYSTYLAEVSTDYSLLEELEISLHRFIRFAQEIPMDKHEYQYAPGKWTSKDIIQHLIDCERIFAFRALSFARRDVNSFPSFDEDSYAQVAKGSDRTLMSLLTEYSAVRHSTILLFKTFTSEDLEQNGIASQNRMSVRALGFVIIGHQNHHQKVFEERYL
jgi:uncharacterized damage-inducible protein DinB